MTDEELFAQDPTAFWNDPRRWNGVTKEIEMTPKHQNMLKYTIEKITELYDECPEVAALIISEAGRKAHRMSDRLHHPEDAQHVVFARDIGRSLEFTGRLLWGKSKEGYLTQLWVTLADEWIILNAHPNGRRGYTFFGDERTPENILHVVNDAQWTRDLFKGMGWDRHLHIA